VFPLYRFSSEGGGTAGARMKKTRLVYKSCGPAPVHAAAQETSPKGARHRLAFELVVRLAVRSKYAIEQRPLRRDANQPIADLIYCTVDPDPSDTEAGWACSQRRKKAHRRTVDVSHLTHSHPPIHSGSGARNHAGRAPHHALAMGP